MVDKVDGKDHDRSADRTNQDSPDRRHQVATGGDADQSGQYPVEGQRQRRFFIFHPGNDQGKESACASSQIGGQEYMRDSQAVALAGGGQLRSGVETEPAEPKDKDTQASNGQVMTGDGARFPVFAIFAYAGAYDGRAYQGDPSADRMHDGRSGEVVESRSEGIHHKATGFTVHQPTAAPCPVTADRIDQYADQHRIGQVHGELRTFRHSTRNDGGCRSTEHGLEDQETFDRQFSLVKADVEEMRHPDKPACPEHDPEANRPEQQRTEREVEQVLH